MTENIRVLMAGGYKPVLAKYEGRDHLIVPLAILVEGVHPGSGGPVYYPEKALSDHPDIWNGMPLTLQHPMDDRGQPTSANEPKVLERIKIGRGFNARWDAGTRKVRIDGWLDEAKLASVSPKLLARISAGEAIEVSTGVFTTEDGKPGEWNGEKFIATAHRLRGDHIALLPDGVGACSLADGCGIRANEEVGGMDVKGLVAGFARAVGLTANDLSGNAECVTPPMDVETCDATQIPTTGSVTFTITEVKGRTEERVMADEAKTKLIEELIACPCTRFSANDAEWMGKLEADQLEKLRVPDGVGVLPKEEPKADEVVAEKKDETEAVAEPAPATLEAKPVTFDELLANADPATREMWRRGMDQYKADRDRVVAKIKANERNAFSEDELRAMPIEHLERLVKLAGDTTDYGLRPGGAPVTANTTVPKPPDIFEIGSAYKGK